MTSEALALAVLALAPAGTVLGEVPPMTPLPWRSISLSIPGSPERSDAATAHLYQVRISATVSTPTEQGTHREAARLIEALDGARLAVGGWLCGPILLDGMGTPYMAATTVQQSNTRLSVVHFSFLLAASRLPA